MRCRIIIRAGAAIFPFFFSRGPGERGPGGKRGGNEGVARVCEKFRATPPRDGRRGGEGWKGR